MRTIEWKIEHLCVCYGSVAFFSIVQFGCTLLFYKRIIYITIWVLYGCTFFCRSLPHCRTQNTLFRIYSMIYVYWFHSLLICLAPHFSICCSPCGAHVNDLFIAVKVDLYTLELQRLHKIQYDDDDEAEEYMIYPMHNNMCCLGACALVCVPNEINWVRVRRDDFIMMPLLLYATKNKSPNIQENFPSPALAMAVSFVVRYFVLLIIITNFSMIF